MIWHLKKVISTNNIYTKIEIMYIKYIIKNIKELIMHNLQTRIK